jgi:hypothetical protein
MDILPSIGDLEGLDIVSLPLTLLAEHVNIGKKVHCDPDFSISLAGLASPSLDIETETTGLVSSRPCLRQPAEKFPDRGKDAGIGSGI